MDRGGWRCGTCDISLGTSEAYRQHAKSEWHVYKLQCRVAPEGTLVQPPSSRTDGDGDGAATKPEILGYSNTSNCQSGDSQNQSLYQSEDDDQLDDDDDEGDVVVPELLPDQCLFCGERCGNFDACIAHMTKAHSFIIPNKCSLDVDLELLLWYLHLVIYGYHECISCSTRRSTVEATQQHMVAKGHCRFDLSGEFADFYDSSQLESQSPGGFVRVDGTTMRLSTGKLLTSRSSGHLTAKSYSSSSHRSSGPLSPQLPDSDGKPSNLSLLDKKDRQLEVVKTQMSRLSVNDRKSLAHLPASEQRSILLTRKKQLDKANRLERHIQSKVLRQGNMTLRKQYLGKGPGKVNG